MRTNAFLLAAASILLGIALLVPLTLASCGRPSRGPAAGAGKWASHTGKVPFVVGWEKGLAAAQAKRPLAILFTADW